MERKSSLLTASKVLGIISTVAYGIVMVGMLATLAFPTDFNIVMSISWISNFVFCILGTVWCNKAKTYWSKEYCIKAGTVFIVLSCVTFNILTILSAIFCLVEKKNLDESDISVKGSVIVSSVVCSILGALPLIYSVFFIGAIGSAISAF